MELFQPVLEEGETAITSFMKDRLTAQGRVKEMVHGLKTHEREERSRANVDRGVSLLVEDNTKYRLAQEHRRVKDVRKREENRHRSADRGWDKVFTELANDRGPWSMHPSPATTGQEQSSGSGWRLDTCDNLMQISNKIVPEYVLWMY